MTRLLLLLILSISLVLPIRAQEDNTPVCTSPLPELEATSELMSVNGQSISVEQFSNRVQFEQAYNTLKFAVRVEALANDAEAMASDSQIQTINNENSDPSQLGNRVLGELARDVIIWEYASANEIVVLSADLTATIEDFFNITDEIPEEREIIIDDFNQRLLANGTTLSEISTFFCRRTLYNLVQDTVIGELETTLYINADHILMSSQEVAQDIITLIENGEDFATLAQELSLDVASAERGGALGWQPAVFYIPAFATVATEIDLNTLSAPVQTSFGWHIIRVNAREERPVEDELRDFVEESLFTRWRNKQVSQAEITINPEWQSFIPNS